MEYDYPKFSKIKCLKTGDIIPYKYKMDTISIGDVEFKVYLLEKTEFGIKHYIDGFVSLREINNTVTYVMTVKNSVSLRNIKDCTLVEYIAVYE